MARELGRILLCVVCNFRLCQECDGGNPSAY